MNPLTQSTSPSRDLAIAPSRTFLPLVFVSVALGVDEDGALELVEDGTLYPCFNVARQESHRREIRVLRHNLIEHQAGRPIPKVAVEQAIESALPKHLPSSTGPRAIGKTEIKTRLCVSADFVRLLILDGQLKTIPKPGSTQSAVLFSSLVDWLKRRAL